MAGGTVQAGDGVYVERAADAYLLHLCRRAAFAYVLTPRQMGKSSLMIRTAEKLLAEGVKPVIVDLTELGATTTAEQWYRGFLEKISEQLDLLGLLAEWWNNQQYLSAPQRFNRFVADIVLRQVRDRIVIFVDEIDTTLRFDFTADFFAGIRYLYSAGASNFGFRGKICGAGDRYQMSALRSLLGLALLAATAGLATAADPPGLR